MFNSYGDSINYERALIIAKKIKDQTSEGIWIGNLGYNYDRLGEYIKARDCFESAVIILVQTIGPDHHSTKVVESKALSSQSINQSEIKQK